MTINRCQFSQFVPLALSLYPPFAELILSFFFFFFSERPFNLLIKFSNQRKKQMDQLTITQHNIHINKSCSFDWGGRRGRHNNKQEDIYFIINTIYDSSCWTLLRKNRNRNRNNNKQGKKETKAGVIFGTWAHHPWQIHKSTPFILLTRASLPSP